MNQRRFVILEHRWQGVHWDFLVEDGPALRTWAIDQPIVADVDLPARPLPDHRPIYLEYEGEISGDRGSVQRWDSGTCEILEWGPDRVRLRVAGVQIAGLAEFRCLGETDVRCWTFRLGKLS
jgi:hypothetical protein